MNALTMRTCSILRIGIAISLTIYSASSVKVTVGKRRNRRVIRRGSTFPEPPNRGSNGKHIHGIPRYLGVGLDNLKYGNTREQYHNEGSRVQNKRTAKGKGNYDSDDLRGTGKGNFPNNGKGGGKGYNNPGSLDSEDLPRPLATEPPFSTPTVSAKSRKPTHQKKEHLNSKRSKQTKLKKSDKGSRTYEPILQPTRLPTIDKPTPSPFHTSTDNLDKLPSSVSNDHDITGLLTPYAITYTVTNNERPPFRSELLEVVELTRVYLDNYFVLYYENSELTNLSKVMTLFTNTAFEFGEAIPIYYESKAILELSSILLPDKKDLDNILVSAFEKDALDGYIGLLQSLPPSNIFSSTQYARLVPRAKESSIIESKDTSKKHIAKNMTLGSIVVGGVAGLILIFASTKNLRRHKHRESDRSAFGNKSSVTITGETFTTHGSRQDDRMLKPICDELYSDDVENRR